MPLHEYQCKKCGHRFERIQKLSRFAGVRPPSRPGARRRNPEHSEAS
ncbi:MAG: FmdB family zinc ribbon protein [Terriglobales bacterium]